jgi:hypothetical protein
MLGYGFHKTPFPDMDEGVLIILSPTRKETSYSDQAWELFNKLPMKLNTLLSPLL